MNLLLNLTLETLEKLDQLRNFDPTIQPQPTPLPFRPRIPQATRPCLPHSSSGRST